MTLAVVTVWLAGPDLPDAEATENRSLAEAAKRVPNGVICLLSALRFHEMTTQAPFEVWIAIGERAWRPRIEYPRLRIVRFSQSTLSAGVKEHRIEGVPVRVFEPAKTVADCFKYRNKIGLDVAIEALRECWGERRCKMDDLWQFADLYRVRNVMRPYPQATAAKMVSRPYSETCVPYETRATASPSTLIASELNPSGT